MINTFHTIKAPLLFVSRSLLSANAEPNQKNQNKRRSNELRALVSQDYTLDIPPPSSRSIRIAVRLQRLFADRFDPLSRPVSGRSRICQHWFRCLYCCPEREEVGGHRFVLPSIDDRTIICKSSMFRPDYSGEVV